MGNCVGNCMRQYHTEKTTSSSELQVSDYWNSKHVSGNNHTNAINARRRGRSSSVHPLYHVRENSDQYLSNEPEVMGMSNCSGYSSSKRKKCGTFKHLPSQRHGDHVRRIKVLVSSKQLSQLLSQGHTKDTVASLLLEKLQIDGFVNVGIDASCIKRNNHSWRPSLEDIPEVFKE